MEAFCVAGKNEVAALLAVLPEEARERVQALLPALQSDLVRLRLLRLRNRWHRRN